MKKPFPKDETLEEWFMRSIRDEIPEKPSYSEEDLITVAKMFFDFFEFDGDAYIGINSLLQHIYGVLLQKALKEAGKHNKIGKELRAIPEVAKIKKEIDEYEMYCKKYFKYNPETNEFIDENE